MNRLYRRTFGVAAKAVAAAFVLLLMFHAVANALTRSLFNSPIEGTLEYVGNWYLPIVILLGLVVAQERKEHIEATLLWDKMPRRIQREFQVLIHVATIAFSLFVAWYSYVQAYDAYVLRTTAGVSGVAIWPVLFVAPIGFLLFAVQVVLDLVDLVLGRADVPEGDHGLTAVPTADSLTTATPTDLATPRSA
ncbi:TRAP transporter small permease [Janibacter sp. G1551]|uniref:TRAP transporter small permease n=1 Tax=Janibacter sp. G1551 TaxID=3420440 RepID=UPI003D038465